MYASKRIAVVAATFAVGVLGATSTAAAEATTPKAVSSATATPTAGHSSTKGGVSPNIRSEPCTPFWGVQVWRGSNCTAFGFVGTAYPYWTNAGYTYTYNNYGWFEYNGHWEEFGTCEPWNFTGDTLQAIEIDGYVAQGTC